MPAGRQVRDPILQECRHELCKRGQIRSPAGWPHLGLRRNSAVAPAVPALLPVQRSSRRGLPNASKAPTMLMRKNSARPAFSIRSSSPAGGAHRRGDRPVAPAGALVRELVEAEWRLAVRHWVAREADVAEVKVDVAGFGQLEGRANGVFMASEELRHLLWALQRPLRIGRQATADILERGSMADGRQDVVEQSAAAMVVADVVGGDGSRPVAFGERCPRLQYPDVVRPRWLCSSTKTSSLPRASWSERSHGSSSVAVRKNRSPACCCTDSSVVRASPLSWPSWARLMRRLRFE